MLQQHRHSYQRFFNTCSVSNTSVSRLQKYHRLLFSQRASSVPTTPRCLWTQQLSTFSSALQQQTRTSRPLTPWNLLNLAFLKQIIKSRTRRERLKVSETSSAQWTISSFQSHHMIFISRRTKSELWNRRGDSSADEDQKLQELLDGRCWDRSADSKMSIVREEENHLLVRQVQQHITTFKQSNSHVTPERCPTRFSNQTEPSAVV